MNKQEFLEYLEKKLNGLSKTELNDILFEYSTHIDNKVLEGSSEQEAITDFGDIDVLVSEILLAYKTDDNFKANSFKNKLRYYLDRSSEFITDLTDAVCKLNKQDFKNILVKGIILTICLSIVNLPFNIIQNTIYHISNIFPDFIANTISGIFVSLLSLIYFVVCTYAVYIFISKEILRHKIGGKNMDTEYSPGIGKDISVDLIKAQNINNKHSHNNGLLESILSVILKVIVFFIILPLLFISIAVIVGTGFVLSLVFAGYPLIGVAIILTGIIISLVSVIVPGMKFIFNWERKNEKVFN